MYIRTRDASEYSICLYAASRDPADRDSDCIQYFLSPDVQSVAQQHDQVASDRRWDVPARVPWQWDEPAVQSEQKRILVKSGSWVVHEVSWPLIC